MEPPKYVSAVRDLYEKHANPANAIFMEAYMKNHFPFFGIKKPERVVLSQQIIQTLGIPDSANLATISQLCFTEEKREMQYFVNDVVGKMAKKLGVDFLPTLESLIVRKSWWDTVDFLAPKLAGKILFRFPEQIFVFPDRWIESDNIWLQRSALLFQLDFKENTNADLLYQYVLRRADSKEFFVQKAAGWALRAYSKVNPSSVSSFIDRNTLPKLTIREGLKQINRQQVGS